jgi:hypothetical protein
MRDSATGLVTTRRTARSQGFFDGGCPDTCPSLLHRGGMVRRRPHLRLHLRRVGRPSHRPHLRFAGTRSGGIPPPPPSPPPRRAAQPPPPPSLRWDPQRRDSSSPLRRLRRVGTLTRRRPHRVGLLPCLSPATSSRGTQRLVYPSTERGPSRCYWVAPSPG